MGFELERILYETEDFLRRHISSASAQQAKKRRWQRKMREFGRRLRRSAFLLVGLLAALVAYSIFVDPIGFLTWLVAIPTAFLVALVSLLWPTRGSAPEPARPGATIPLDQMAIRVEEGLIDRRDELPGHALPAADAILARLNELQPHLAALAPDSLESGEARRLICQHLPKLVDSYLDLPPSARASGSESSRRFAESLDIVAGELDHLLERCCRDRQLSFETQNRFIESRYKEDERLRRQ